MPFRIDQLREQFVQARAGIQTIDDRARAENRELTEDESEQQAQLFLRAQQLGDELEPLAERHRSIDATAQILAGLGVGGAAGPLPGVVHGPGPGVTDVSPGEYFSSYLRAIHPDNPNMRGDLADHIARYRTVATQTTADTPSLLPAPIVGPVINFIDANRYVVPTFSPRPMTEKGKTFTRPRISQHVNVAEQAAELDELASQKMTLTSDTVTKRTFGGSLQMSQQDIDWTDPSALDLVFADFADIYMKRTDAAAAASLLAACPAASIAWVGTSLGTIMTTFATAATSVYASSSALPTDLWVSLDVGLALGALTTSVGDVVFPNIGVGRLDITEPGLGLAGPLGLNLHICPNFSANTRIVGNRAYAEWYEQRKGFLQVSFPSALKIELAYAGYVTNYFRSEGFVRLFG